MVRKEGKLPVNSRVHVDYSGKKPKVRFGYPDKNTKDARIILSLSLFFLLFFGSYSYYCFNSMHDTPEIYPSECNITVSGFWYNMTTLFITKTINSSRNYSSQEIYGFNLICDTGNYSVIYKDVRLFLSKESGFYSNDDDNSTLLIEFIIISIILFGIPVIFHFTLTPYMVKTRWFGKIFPKANSFIAGKFKRYTFTPKDVIENHVEIPFFKNVDIKYKTSGDFSKYLRKIDITEHPFNFVYLNKGEENKKKQQKNVYVWRCIFKFSQTPKSGKMEVYFK